MNNASRFLFGGLVVMLGIVLLFDQLGIAHGFSRLWPLIIVFTGLYMIIKNFRNVIPGLFVLTIGIFLQLDSLRVLSFSVWNLWPLFIIFGGVSILIGRKDRWSSSKTESGFITSNATFWGDERIVTGEFKGANLTAIFGGIKLDLKDAKIDDRVVIDVNLMFGGVEIILPDNVKVINNGVGIFGGISDKSRKNSDSTKVVEITGSAVFGGVDLK